MEEPAKAPAEKLEQHTEKQQQTYCRIKGGYLELRVKLQAGQLSHSGKSEVLVTTGGFTNIDGTEARINLTVIKGSRAAAPKAW